MMVKSHSHSWTSTYCYQHFLYCDCPPVSTTFATSFDAGGYSDKIGRLSLTHAVSLSDYYQ